MTANLRHSRAGGNPATLITECLDIWISADTAKKSGRGRASGNSINVYGVKKLRELILELAVRGKLVPQDPKDEPAGELLKRIQVQKEKLIKSGKIRKGQQLPLITDNDKYFDLPNGWDWSRLGNIGDWGAGATPLRSISSYYGGKTPWFKSGELIADFIDTSEETITELALKECSLRLNQPGDVLIAMYGATIGKAAILKVAGTTNQAVCACTPNKGIFNRYLLLLLKAMKSNFIGQGAGGAQPNISREKIIATLAPFPPQLEQHRIVAKVDELMALCDQLEAQHNNVTEAHEKIVSVLLETLTQSTDAKAFTENWQRIATHFDTLFTTESSIDALKQTLLQLAVRGKLAPQDMDSENADVTYSKNIKLPKNLERSGKQKIRDKSIIAKDKLPTIPETWSYKSIDQLYLSNHILDYADGNHGSLYPRKADFGKEGVLFLTAAQISNNGYISWDQCPRLKYPIAKQLLKGWATENDVFFTHNATVGRTAYAHDCPESKFLLGTSVTYYRINENSIEPKYLCLYFASPSWQAQAELVMKQTTRNQVSITKQALFFVALPPLAEQRRIVAKIDELMTLCEQLKARVTKANQLQQKLVDVMIEKAVA